MRIVIQRVSEASVSIKDTMKSAIQQGFLILLGIGEDDSEDDIEWLVKKVVNLRVFDDEKGIMNKSILDVNGEILVVSQFIPLYQQFCERLSAQLGKEVGTGEFGADMQVKLVNDGPVTICMDTKNKE